MSYLIIYIKVQLFYEIKYYDIRVKRLLLHRINTNLGTFFNSGMF